ncbi:hypothetical protein TIFTF001_026367 [Ficus carica]|uniref:Legumain prodomain domain-containing protein n=1 Tax=Ficus carica TaxID=3494 RepID=A0AA88ITA0_FICCA|nr:hypothetical protein TIFTF001_026367 [Ficus carica]
MRFPVGSPEYNATKKEYDEIFTLMKNEEENIEAVSKLVFGIKERPIAKVPYADDLYYYKTLSEVYARYCRRLSKFGSKLEKHILDMYEIGITADELAAACIKVCSK